MPVRFLIVFLFLSPGVLLAKQEQYEKITEQDLELFEFLAMYEKNDAVFIDAEIDEKSVNNDLKSQHVKTSESDE